MPIEYLRPRAVDRPMAAPADGDTVVPVMSRVVRCACEQCGAHTNAVWTFRVGGSCPTCGSFRLAPLEGAELMDGPRLVA
jgi:Zn finger protein HypA/HybF involved in hydrogenase expression